MPQKSMIKTKFLGSSRYINETAADKSYQVNISLSPPLHYTLP